MKRIIYTAVLLTLGYAAQAQVGIGTITPAATLDVTGTPATTTILDGIIAPRITGAQLRAKTYTAAQNGAMVYVTAADTAPAGQTIDVTATGQYYFNGTKWVTMGSGSFTETDGIIGNEVTAATTNRGLTRAGAGTTVSPYTLGLTAGTTAGQVMGWNGTTWQPSAATNIYNTSGTLTSGRGINLNGFALQVVGTNQQTSWNNTGYLAVDGNPTFDGVFTVRAAYSNPGEASLVISQSPSGSSRILAMTNTTGLIIGTTNTAVATGIQFNTTGSGGAGTVGTTKMVLTGAGNLGINQAIPVAKLHVVKGASDITPAIIEGCNTYTDNAAATSAGLPVGGLYRKADGTLMVRF